MFTSKASSQAGRERFTLSRSKRLKRALMLRAIRKSKTLMSCKEQKLNTHTESYLTPRAA